MYKWDKWRWGARASLDSLARVLGLESSKWGIDGSRVYDEFCAGRHDEIACYCCMRDVELVRLIYYRLTFAEGGVGEECRARESEGDER